MLSRYVVEVRPVRAAAAATQGFPRGARAGHGGGMPRGRYDGGRAVGALAPRGRESSAVEEWLLTCPGIGIALDSWARVMGPTARPPGASWAVGTEPEDTPALAAGTEGSDRTGATGNADVVAAALGRG